MRSAVLLFSRMSRFGGGSGKALTIDQVYNILMTLKHTGSWIEAFQYIPYVFFTYMKV